jgi:uncharacterized protein (TIGR03083 family)
MEHAMDVSTLHALTEDLAGFLSELTQSELERPTSWANGDVGDLYLHLIDRNLRVAAAITGEAIPRGQWPDPGDRAALSEFLDPSYGGGLETGYRRTARLMEDAFAGATDKSVLLDMKGVAGEVDTEALYELQISDVVLHTWDVAQVLGLTYRPARNTTLRILRSIVLGATRPRRDDLVGGAAAERPELDDVDLFDGVLALSRRSAHQPA